eukprot:scaffold174256_cov30-Tisochrysis_lutea.AAC.1
MNYVAIRCPTRWGWGPHLTSPSPHPHSPSRSPPRSFSFGFGGSCPMYDTTLGLALALGEEVDGPFVYHVWCLGGGAYVYVCAAVWGKPWIWREREKNFLMFSPRARP